MVANPQPPQDDAPREAEPIRKDELLPYGLGWRWQWRVGEAKVRLTFRAFRKVSSGQSAEVTVEVTLPACGVKGMLTVERLSLGDGKARATLANRLAERTGEHGPDWRNMLDGICSRIMVAQRAGPERQQVGLAPERGLSYLIDGLVEERQSTSVYGDGEVGKSWLVIGALVSLASGVEIIPGWRPTRRARAALLDWETDGETINRRVRMACRGAGIPYTAIDYYACSAPFSEQLEWLLEKVQEEQIALIGIDSVEAAMSGSKSDGGDMNEAAAKMNFAIRKLNAAGCAVLLVDHVNAMSAASKGLAGKQYGSIFKRNWTRAALEIKRTHEGQSAGSAHLGLYCTKRNNGARYDPRGLLWRINDELTAWEPEEISAPDLAAALPIWRRMVIALEEEQPLSISTLAELCGTKPGQIAVELSRRKGTFRRDGNDRVLLADVGRPRLEVIGDGEDEPDELPFP